MVRLVDFSIIFASSNTKLSIQSEAVLPLTFRTRVEREPDVRCSLSA